MKGGIGDGRRAPARGSGQAGGRARSGAATGGAARHHQRVDGWRRAVRLARRGRASTSITAPMSSRRCRSRGRSASRAVRDRYAGAYTKLKELDADGETERASLSEQIAEVARLRDAGLFDASRDLSLSLLLPSIPMMRLLNYQAAWTHDRMGLEHEAVPFYERAIAAGLDGEDLARRTPWPRQHLSRDRARCRRGTDARGGCRALSR